MTLEEAKQLAVVITDIVYDWNNENVDYSFSHSVECLQGYAKRFTVAFPVFTWTVVVDDEVSPWIGRLTVASACAAEDLTPEERAAYRQRFPEWYDADGNYISDSARHAEAR